MTPDHRQNNFDLIRLLAAMQVVLAHGIGHTGLINHLSPLGRQLFDALLLFPGVPVFFVISGFLIARSFERKPGDLRGYLWRRSLRIFPALWVCLAVTLVTLGAFGFLGSDFLFSKTFVSWLAGQLSFFQFYNPEHFRGFGMGVANGALWTITVELQFYLFVPLFYHLVRCKIFSGKQAARLSSILFLISFCAYCMMDHKVNGPSGFTGAPLVYKLLHVTLLPHLWMFLLGVFLHRHFEEIRPWIEGRFLWYLAAYALFMACIYTWVEFRSIPFYLAYLPSRVLLALGTIAAAFSARFLSQKLLFGTDLSYGTYLYHSVVINIFMQLEWMNSIASVVQVTAVSILLALLSWHWIEKPALACKSLSPTLLWRRVTARV